MGGKKQSRRVKTNFTGVYFHRKRGQCIIKFKDFHSGKYREKILTTSDPAEAAYLRSQYIAGKGIAHTRQGVVNNPTDDSSALLKPVLVTNPWDKFRVGRDKYGVFRKECGSYQTYKCYFHNHILPYWGNTDVSKIDQKDVEAFRNHLFSKATSTSGVMTKNNTVARPL